MSENETESQSMLPQSRGASDISANDPFPFSVITQSSDILDDAYGSYKVQSEFKTGFKGLNQR